MNKTYLFPLFTIILVCAGGFGYGQDSIFYATRPEFMQTLFLDGNYLLRKCECVDEEGQKSEDLEQILSCKTYITERQNILSPDSSSSSLETLNQIHLSTYTKKGEKWEHKRYSLAGELMSVCYQMKDPGIPTVTESAWGNNIETGGFVEYRITYYFLQYTSK